MPQPNLIFVFPDQMRGQAMGFLGREPVQTPNLDRFAGEGLVLDQVSSTYPLCSPYRAMLMTGQYSHSNGVVSNCNSYGAPQGIELREGDRCWSDVLKDRGYALGYIGKWHLDAPYEPYIDCANNREDPKWNEWCPPHRRHGFDFWYSYGTYDFHDQPMYWRGDAGREEFHFVDQWGPEHEADLALQYLRNEDGAYRDPDKPFAMVVSMNPPHTPYERVPQKYVDRYADVSDEALFNRPNVPPAGTEWGDHYRENIRNYYAMISGVDEQFGRILEALRETGLEDDTIVVFTSDHGDCIGIHHEVTKNNHYEESLQVPFLIRWPGKIAPGRDDLLLSAPDICPTLLGLLGCADAIPESVEGTNFAEIFLGGEQQRPTSQLYLGIDRKNPLQGRRGIRTHGHTFMIDRREPGEHVVLHDNREDPYQLENIAADHPERVGELSRELSQWLQKTGDPWAGSVKS